MAKYLQCSLKILRQSVQAFKSFRPETKTAEEKTFICECVWLCVCVQVCMSVDASMCVLSLSTSVLTTYTCMCAYVYTYK